MLLLRDDSFSFDGSRMVTTLLSQLEDTDKRLLFSRYLIRAALELFVETIRLNAGLGIRRHLPFDIAEGPHCHWRIGGLGYLYVPAINDSALQKWRTPLHPRATIVIVPPQTESVFKAALENELKGSTPEVMSLADFIGWRLMFGSIDAGWRYDQATEWLINQYNDIIGRRRLDSSLLIGAPT